jgi:hypothetical protein
VAKKTESVEWQYYPKSDEIPLLLKKVVTEFNKVRLEIQSSEATLVSNQVLAKLRSLLEELGFTVERSKASGDRIKVPVLFGRNGVLEKWFDADAVHVAERTVLEIEAGRGVTNNDFLKHLLEACLMHDIDYFVLAVRINYRGNADFEHVYRFFDTLYASGRIQLPLKGVLVIGY